MKAKKALIVPKVQHVSSTRLARALGFVRKAGGLSIAVG